MVLQETKLQRSAHHHAKRAEMVGCRQKACRLAVAEIYGFIPEVCQPYRAKAKARSSASIAIRRRAS